MPLRRYQLSETHDIHIQKMQNILQQRCCMNLHMLHNAVRRPHNYKMFKLGKGVVACSKPDRFNGSV